MVTYLHRAISLRRELFYINFTQRRTPFSFLGQTRLFSGQFELQANEFSCAGPLQVAFTW